MLIGITGDSGSGKTTIASLLATMLGDATVLEADCFHKWPRGHPQWKSITHLHPSANHVQEQLSALKDFVQGKPFHIRPYLHKNGTFGDDTLVVPKSHNIVCGLLPFFDDDHAGMYDLRVYIDVQENLKTFLKVKRDSMQRGYTMSHILASIESRRNDFRMHVQPQKEKADVVLHFTTPDNTVVENLYWFEEPYSIHVSLSVRTGCLPWIAHVLEDLEATVTRLNDVWTQVSWEKPMGFENKLTELLSKIGCNVDSPHANNTLACILLQQWIATKQDHRLMLEEYQRLCSQYGGYQTLFQANGGNISVKDHVHMVIKQSGTRVRDTMTNYCWCSVTNIRNQIDHMRAHPGTEEPMIHALDGKTPSMEVGFHALTKKYTLHMHPTEINKWLCSNDSNICGSKLFQIQQSYKVLHMPYVRPGMHIATYLVEHYDQHDIVFMENHGVICTSESMDKMQQIMSDIIKIFEPMIMCSMRIQYVCGNGTCAYISMLPSPPHLCMRVRAYTPDMIVLLGFEIVSLGSKDATKDEINAAIENYRNKYGKHPIVLMADGRFIIIQKNRDKCRDVEEVLESYLELAGTCDKELACDEGRYLSSWEKETFRASRDDTCA